MPVDARIPLGGNAPASVNPLAVLGNVAELRRLSMQEREQAMRMAELERQQRGQTQLREVFRLSRTPGGEMDWNVAAREAMTVDPEMGLQLQQHISQMNAAQRQEAQQRAGIVGQALASVTDQPTYDRARAELEQQGISGLNPTFNPEQVQWAARRALSVKDQIELMTPAEERGQPLMNLGGGRVFDPNTRTMVYEPPAGVTPENAPNVGSFEDYVLRRFGPKPTDAQILTARKDYMQSDDRPITVNAGQGGGLSPAMESNVINRLSKQWQTLSAPVADLTRQANLMDAGMAAARRGDMAQGSQVVLVTFQKILDPPSVVRESEYMRSSAGQSLMNRVRGYVEQLAQGGAKIPLPELEKFARLAKEAAIAQNSGYLASQKRRIGLSADRYKIPRDLIFEDYEFPTGEATPPPAAALPPPTGGGNLPPLAVPRGTPAGDGWTTVGGFRVRERK